MESDKTILDNPDQEVIPQKAFKSYVPRDLMIVVGVVFLIFGVYFLYVFIESVHQITSRSFRYNNAYFVSSLIARFLILIYAIALIIAGFGLILRKILGWIFGLAVVIFIILAVLIAVIRSFINHNFFWTEHAWIFVLVIFISGLIITFLLSKPIRNYFNPTRKEYGISALIVTILVGYLLAIPLLF